MTCAIAFGKNLSTKQGEFIDPMGYVEDKEAC